MDAESSQIQDELSINLQAVIDSWDYRFAASLKVCSQEWILTAKLNTNLQRAIITRAWLGLISIPRT